MIQESFNPVTENFEVINLKPKKYKTKIRATSIESFYQVLETIGEKEAISKFKNKI